MVDVPEGLKIGNELYILGKPVRVIIDYKVEEHLVEINLDNSTITIEELVKMLSLELYHRNGRWSGLGLGKDQRTI